MTNPTKLKQTETDWWLTKEQAAEKLHRSSRRVIDLVEKGLIRGRKITIGPSGRPILEVHGADVAAQAEKGQVPRLATEAGKALAPLQALLPLLQRPPEVPLTSRDPLMTLQDGAAYIGSTPEDLLDAVRTGELAVRWARGTKQKHGQMDRCRVTRSALDAWAKGVPLATGELVRAAVV